MFNCISTSCNISCSFNVFSSCLGSSGVSSFYFLIYILPIYSKTEVTKIRDDNFVFDYSCCNKTTSESHPWICNVVYDSQLLILTSHKIIEMFYEGNAI